jgi:hypothetical protein
MIQKYIEIVPKLREYYAKKQNIFQKPILIQNNRILQKELIIVLIE